MDLKASLRNLKTDVPAVFLALKRKETPLSAKLLAGIIVGYALSPIDFIPDFIPLLGLLDDAIILPLLIALFIKLIPKDVFEECREQAKGLWTGVKPKKWYYAVPIVLIWVFIVFLIVRAFL